MLWHQADALHCICTQARAQAFDELRHAHRVAPAACEQVTGLFTRLQQNAASQAQGTNGFGQLRAREPFAQQSCHLPRLRRGLGESQSHASCWCITVCEPELEHVYRASPGLQVSA